MKNILLVLVFSFSFDGLHLLAQQALDRPITGRVLDETHSPVIFAIVNAKDLKIFTSTDFNGWFSQLSLTDTFPGFLIAGIENETEKINCKYYPNPTTGLLNIDVKGNIQELFLCDVSGRLLQRFEVNGEDKLELDISPYPIGTYRIMYFESINVARSGIVVLAK